LRITYNPFLLFWFLISVFILNIDLFFTLKRFKTDIVVCNTIQEAIFLGVPVKILNKKLVIYFKNILDKNWKKRIRSGFCDIFANGVIGVSEKALRDYTNYTSKKHINNKIIDVIHDGIDCKKLNVIDRSQNIADRYKSDYGGLIILNIGNLTELKGQLLLLKAIRSPRIRDLDIKVLLIGDIYHHSELEYKERVIDFINKNDLKNKVYMLGYRKDIKSFLSVGDVLVHCPIKDDAFPRVILEAFCFKKIVIGTSIGGIPEMIENDYNGILCRVNPDSLAEKILYVYNNREKLTHLGENAYESAKDDFFLKKQVVETEKLYKKIVQL